MNWEQTFACLVFALRAVAGGVGRSAAEEGGGAGRSLPGSGTIVRASLAINSWTFAEDFTWLADDTCRSADRGAALLRNAPVDGSGAAQPERLPPLCVRR